MNVEANKAHLLLRVNPSYTANILQQLHLSLIEAFYDEVRFWGIVRINNFSVTVVDIFRLIVFIYSHVVIFH